MFCGAAVQWFIHPSRQRKYSHHIWHLIGQAVWACTHTRANTQPLTITDTQPPLLLIPSPPAVKISLPSNPL